MKYLIASFLICIIACKHKTTKTPYVSVEAEIVYENIITRLPGSIYVKDSIFIWQDVFATDSFLHIVDIHNKNEIGKYGKIGKGPEEFTTPQVGSCFENELVIHDVNGSFQTYFQIKPFLNKENPYKPLTNKIKKSCTAVIGIADDELISLQPEESPFLVYLTKDSLINFGNTPFNKEYINGFEVNQGHIAYNKEKGILVYAMSAYPYFAVYNKYGNEFQLQSKITGDLDFSLSNKKLLFDPSKRGIFSVALTKDYIITHQRDYDKDNIDERTVGIDLSKVPSTIFVHTYKGELVKIIDIGKPIIRLNSIYNDDILYAIVANPDYTLIRINLEQ